MTARSVIWSGLLLMALGQAMTARAAMLRCASHELNATDRIQAFGHAKKQVSRQDGLVSLGWACSNSDFAIATFKTQVETDADGLLSWWALECRRQRLAWTCESKIREHRVEVEFERDAEPVRVAGSVPDGFPTDRAKVMIAEAARLASQTDMPLSRCEHSFVIGTWPNPRELDWNSGLDYPTAALKVEYGGIVVNIGYKLFFQFVRDDQALCWGEYLVVD
jgi:hypothetical protein